MGSETGRARKFAFNFHFAQSVGLPRSVSLCCLERAVSPASLLPSDLQITLCRKWSMIKSLVSLDSHGVGQRQLSDTTVTWSMFQGSGAPPAEQAAGCWGQDGAGAVVVGLTGPRSCAARAVLLCRAA